MKDVFCICPEPRDATSFYRGMGPIGEMRKQSGKYRFNCGAVNSSVNWSVLSQYDIVFLQRPFRDDHTKIAEMAIGNGKKLWIDYDDDLLNIPESNWVAPIYRKNNARGNVEKCVKMAHMITTSTKEIKDRLGGGDNIYVVPNALDTSMFILDDKIEPDFKKVYWRGSKTHVEDIFEFLHSIELILTKFPDITFHFIGELGWPNDQYLGKHKNVQLNEPKDVVEFNHSLKYLNPCLNIVPLHDNPFNHGKSMCAWLEASFAGAASVGPDFAEWQRPGITRYSNPTEFIRETEYLLNNPDQIRARVKESRDYIKKNLTLEHTANLRLSLLDEI